MYMASKEIETPFRFNNRETLGSSERELLLKRLWEEKKERRDTGAGLGMYVALDGPEIRVDEVIKGVLQQLLTNPVAGRNWAEDWGRVVVGVHPTKLGTVCLEKAGVKTKPYMRVESSELVDPTVVLASSQLTGKNKIVVNEQKVVREGLVVEVIHLLDELIWQKYLGFKDRFGLADAYELAVREVVEEGVELLTASEAYLLEMIGEEKFKARLYGSEAIGSVPKLMGGVVFGTDEKTSAIDLSGRVGDEIEFGGSFLQTEVAGKIGFGAGVTLGKELHLGHLALLSSAELARLAVGGDQVRLFSNDTGPRVAGMVATLALIRGETVSKVASRLRRGSIKQEEITQAYRSRLTDGSDFLQAMVEVGKGGGILPVVEKACKDNLARLGFDSLVLVRESDYSLRLGKKVLRGLAGEWQNTGFSAARSSRGFAVLEKGGELSATGKVVAYLVDALDDLDSLVVVDGEAHTFDAVDITNFKGMRTRMTAGVGVGINGKMGSGSGGELPRLSELIQGVQVPLKEILRFLTLTGYTTSRLNPNSVAVGRFYDFASKEAIVPVLEQNYARFLVFKDRVLTALEKTKAASAIKTMVGKRYVRRLDELPNELWRLMEIKPAEFLDNFDKWSRLGESPGFEGEANKLSMRAKKDMREWLLRRVLEDGLKDNREVAMYLRKGGVVHDVGRLPEKVVNIESRYLQVVLDQGYERERAIERVLQYQAGELMLFRRRNMYFEELMGLLKMVEEVEVWEAGDASLVREMVYICLERLGIDL